MDQMNYLTYLYGILLGLFLFMVIRSLYSVYYTPGVQTLYNSPVTQQLFPNALKKLYPTWGYNSAGMYDNQPFRFGADKFWPKSGQGYKPTKYGYGGPSPMGGERQTLPIPKEVPVGYWGKTPQYVKPIDVPVQGQETIPSEKVVEVGWWNE